MGSGADPLPNGLKNIWVSLGDITPTNGSSYNTTWKAKCPIFKALVAGFRGKVA